MPESAYFIHLDWVIRSYAERLQKLISYEQQSEAAGYCYARFYLPKLHHERQLRPPVYLRRASPHARSSLRVGRQAGLCCQRG